MPASTASASTRHHDRRAMGGPVSTLKGWIDSTVRYVLGRLVDPRDLRGAPPSRASSHDC